MVESKDSSKQLATSCRQLLSKAKNIIVSVFGTVRLHWKNTKKPTFLRFVSIFYFFWMVSSVVQESVRFRAIGVDIFDYAVVNDFVLVPFGDLDALISLAVMVAIVAAAYVVGFVAIVCVNRSKNNANKSGLGPDENISRPAFQFLGYGAIGYFLAVLILGTTYYNARYNKHWLYNFLANEDNRVCVSSQSGVGWKYYRKCKEYTLYGTAGGYVFLLEDLDQRIPYFKLRLLIIPQQSIEYISKRNKTVNVNEP